MIELTLAGTPLFNIWTGVVMGATIAVCCVSVYRARKGPRRKQNERRQSHPFDELVTIANTYIAAYFDRLPASAISILDLNVR
jgi:hypothetical protein